MINRIKYFFPIVCAILLISCHQEYYFDYKILDTETDISTLPFGNNQDLTSSIENKIDYKVINFVGYIAYVRSEGSRLLDLSTQVNLYFFILFFINHFLNYDLALIFIDYKVIDFVGYIR